MCLRCKKWLSVHCIFLSLEIIVLILLLQEELIKFLAYFIFGKCPLMLNRYGR